MQKWQLLLAKPLEVLSQSASLARPRPGASKWYSYSSVRPSLYCSSIKYTGMLYSYSSLYCITVLVLLLYMCLPVPVVLLWLVRIAGCGEWLGQIY